MAEFSDRQTGKPVIHSTIYPSIYPTIHTTERGVFSMAKIMMVQVRNHALKTFLAGKRSFRIWLEASLQF